MATAQTVREMLAENSSQAFIELLTIRASGFADEYLALNSEDIVSRGNTYKAAYMKLDLPKKTGVELQNATITLGNISQDMIDIIRTVEEPPTLVAELVPLTRPDTVEDGPYDFRLLQVTYDASTIQCKLGNLPVFDERFPAHDYTPIWFPALFAA